MTTILYASNSQTDVQQVGDLTAQALGYRYVGRALLEQVAEQHKVPVSKLLGVLDGSGTSRFSVRRHHLLLSYIQAAALQELVLDNVVCGGLGVHLFVREISHILTVRLTRDPQVMINLLAAKLKTSPRKAAKVLEREGICRARWVRELFGMEEGDPSHYDIVINLGKLDLEEVVSIVKDMAGYRKFQPMSYSRKCLQDLALAARVKAAVLPRFPDILVGADGDAAIVQAACPKRLKQKTVESVKELAGQVAGVARVEVHTVTSLGKSGVCRGLLSLQSQV